MSDVLTAIFTDEVLGRLRKCAVNSGSAEYRFRILSAPSATPDSADSASCGQHHYGQTRERWNRWIVSAVSAGMFQEPHGTELKSRLTGTDDDGFRSALAECMTCWALSSELGLALVPHPSGRGRRVLEFAVLTSQGEISLEVKSPRIRRSSLSGPESGRSATALNIYSVAVAMRAALRSANRQFARAQRNILVIALPEIDERAAITSETWPAWLIRAFYGEQRMITARSGPPASQWLGEGNFLKRPGGVPRFTRISAVVGLREFGCHPELQAAVLHNPYSEKPVDSSMFGNWAQFVADGGEINRFRLATSSIGVSYSF